MMTEQLIDPMTGEDMQTGEPGESVRTDSETPQATDATDVQSADEAGPVPAAETPLQKKQKTWAALPYDSVQILRLAPLTAERETGLRPLLFGCLNRISRHSKEMSMLRLSVVFPDKKFGKNSNNLELWVDHREKTIQILPEHGLFTEPGNRGLGRLLMAQAVEWCSPKWHDYSLPSLELKTKLVPTDMARLRRDHALQAQGFTVTYNDGVQMSASCTAIRLDQLGREWNRDKIRIMDHLEAAHLLYSSDLNLKSQTSQISALNQKLELLQRDDNTMRFTIFTLIFFAIFQAGLLIWMATR